MPNEVSFILGSPFTEIQLPRENQPMTNPKIFGTLGQLMAYKIPKAWQGRSQFILL